MPIALGLAIELGLDAVAVAMLGLAIVAAVVPLGRLTADILARLPGPLAAVAGLGVSAVEGAIGSVVRWADASVNGLAHAIDYPFRAIWTVQVGAAAAAAESALALWRIRFRVLPALETALAQWTLGLFDQALTYARTLFGAAVARADQEFTDAVRYTQAAVQQAEARADAEFAQAVGYAQAVAGVAIARADAEFAQAVGYAQAVGVQAEARADAEFGQAIAYTQAAVADAERFAERVGVAAEDYARSLERVAIDHADAAAAAVAVVAAAAAAAVGARVKDLEDSPCQRFCDPLGGLGQYLQQLEESGLVLALIGLAGEGAHDPEGTARGVLDLFQAPLQAAGSEVRQAAGF